MIDLSIVAMKLHHQIELNKAFSQIYLVGYLPRRLEWGSSFASLLC